MATLNSPGIIKLIFIIILFGYIGLMLYAAVFANQHVFPAPPAGYKDSPEILKFTYNDKGDSVSMVYLQNPGSKHLIYYHHGNGEDLHSILPRIEALRNAGFSVLAWDYPGYGTSDGKPSEGLVNSIAEKLYQAIPESFGFSHEKTILYGRSLGGGPVIWLATRHECEGLILEGTFASIFRVGLPLNILPWDIFDNLKRIKSIKCPALLIHGTHDKVVPFSHALKLYSRAPDPKFYAWMDNGEHNDIIEAYPESYFGSLHRFVEFLEKS